MKVLLYADFRSPHAKGWKRGLEEAGIEVVALSSEREYGDPEQSKVDNRHPNDKVSKIRGRVATYLQKSDSKISSLLRRNAESQPVHSLVYLMRRRGLVRRLQTAVRDEQPDLIHSLRIPYESVTALHAKLEIPWVVSTWGQDFVPQAASDRSLRRWTKSVVRALDGIHYDSLADFDRATHFGLRPDTPRLYAAGNFGVDSDLFFDDGDKKNLVVYPRKITGTCNYWGFVHAVADLLVEFPEQVFVGIGLKPIEGQIIDRYPDMDLTRFHLTDVLSQEQYASYIRRATVVVSPAYSDGIPNSLLEAVSAGARVVAGYLPQLQRLSDESNLDFVFVDAKDAASIASGIATAIRCAPKDGRVTIPIEMVRAENHSRVVDFYEKVTDRSPRGGH